MKGRQIIFSPTGGTKKVADLLAGEWNLKREAVDLTDPSVDFGSISVEKEELTLIAVPSYGGRVPALAVKRFRQIKGNGARCVIVCVYGNRAYEDTLTELEDLAEECGFEVIAAVAAIAEHSIMHQYATGRPDREDEQELKEFAEKIWKKFQEEQSKGQIWEQEKRKISDFKVPGNRPYKESAPVPMVPKAEDGCNQCGICVKKCPAEAISLNHVQEADEKKCISCMRCVVVCPAGARKINAAAAAAVAQKIEKACSVRKRNELYC